MDTDKLKAIGNEWQNGDAHRIYINDLYKFYGLKVRFYASGNVMSATLDGEKISNSEAKAIIAKLDSIKVYFDYADGKLYAKFMGASLPKTAQKIIDAIMEYAE